MIKVKPLDWKPYRGGDAEAVALGTIYTAFVSGYWRTQKDPKFKKGGEDLEAAKAAAQAHHDALILSMVESPSHEPKMVGVDIPRLPVGTPVEKVGGYPFPGTVVAAFHTLAGQERFVVEATGEAYAGMLHIFNGGQLRANTEGQP